MLMVKFREVYITSIYMGCQKYLNMTWTEMKEAKHNIIMARNDIVHWKLYTIDNDATFLSLYV